METNTAIPESLVWDNHGHLTLILHLMIFTTFMAATNAPARQRLAIIFIAGLRVQEQ